MRLIVLMVTLFSSLALAEGGIEIVGPFSIGRFSSEIQSGPSGAYRLYELRGLTVKYRFIDQDGEITTKTVRAGVASSSHDEMVKYKTSSNKIWLAYNSSDETVSNYSVRETQTCLGKEFIYDIENEDGSYYQTCYEVWGDLIVD